MTVTALGTALGSVLVAAESVHRDDVDLFAKRGGAGGELGGQRCGGVAGVQVQQPRPARAGDHRGEVDDDGHVARAGGVAGVGPAVLVDPDDPQPVEPGRAGCSEQSVVASTAMVLMVSQDRPSSRATAATATRSAARRCST